MWPWLLIQLTTDVAVAVVDALSDTRMMCVADDVVVTAWSDDVVVIVPEDDGVRN